MLCKGYLVFIGYEYGFFHFNSVNSNKKPR